MATPASLATACDEPGALPCRRSTTTRPVRSRAAVHRRRAWFPPPPTRPCHPPPVMRRCIGSSWMRRSAACTDVRGPPSAADAPSALPCRHSPPTRPVGSRAALHRPSPPTRPVPSAADEAGAPVPPSAADTPGGLPRRPSPPTRPVPAAADEAGTLPFHPSPPMSSCNRLSRMGVGGDIGLTFFRSSQVPEVPAGGREKGSAVLPSEGMRGTSTGVGTSFPSDSYHAHKRLSEGYGSTEGGGISIMVNRDECSHVGSAGRVSHNVEVKIVDIVTGEPLSVGQKGELCVRGPAIMTGYVGDAEANAAAFDSEGWLKTGDLCYVDQDGFLFVVDRLKELIKYKAYQVPPAELELVLQSLPEIVDAAVMPYPHEEAGQIPMALVVRQPGSKVTEAQVMEHVAKRVAPYKKVRKVVFVDSIPKSPAGKILRRQLSNHLPSCPVSRL